MCASATNDEPSDARFSLRALLFAMAGVSILAAIAGTVLQDCSSDARQKLKLFWAIWLGSTVAWVCLQFQRRRWAERLAGRTLLRLATSGELVSSATGFWYAGYRLFVVLLTLTFASYLIVGNSSPTSSIDWALQWALPLVLSVGSASHLVPLALWSDVRFCDHGILSDQRLLPWDHVVGHDWKGLNGEKLNVYSADFPGIRPWATPTVALKNHAAVEELFAAKSKLIFKSARVTGLADAPISIVFQEKHLRRQLPYSIASLLAGLGLFYLVVIERTGVREFDEFLPFGAILWSATNASSWKLRASRAGAPLVRLSARQGVAEFIVLVATALALYYVVTHVLLPAAWTAYVASFAFCYLMVRAATYFFMSQLDLRAGGVVMRGAFYCPWKKLRSARWKHSDTENLVLRCRWHRVFVTVTPEARGVVVRVLRSHWSQVHQ